MIFIYISSLALNISIYNLCQYVHVYFLVLCIPVLLPICQNHTRQVITLKLFSFFRSSQKEKVGKKRQKKDPTSESGKLLEIDNQPGNTETETVRIAKVKKNKKKHKD